MRAQEQLAQQSFEGTAGGGAVKATMTGAKQLVDMAIDKAVVDVDDIDMLQDLIVAAIQDVMQKVDEATEKELGKYTRGMNVPGLF